MSLDEELKKVKEERTRSNLLRQRQRHKKIQALQIEGRNPSTGLINLSGSNGRKTRGRLASNTLALSEFPRFINGILPSIKTPFSPSLAQSETTTKEKPLILELIVTVRKLEAEGELFWIEGALKTEKFLFADHRIASTSDVRIQGLKGDIKLAANIRSYLITNSSVRIERGLFLLEEEVKANYAMLTSSPGELILGSGNYYKAAAVPGAVVYIRALVSLTQVVSFTNDGAGGSTSIIGPEDIYALAGFNAGGSLVSASSAPVEGRFGPFDTIFTSDHQVTADIRSVLALDGNIFVDTGTRTSSYTLTRTRVIKDETHAGQTYKVSLGWTAEEGQSVSFSGQTFVFKGLKLPFSESFSISESSADWSDGADGTNVDFTTSTSSGDASGVELMIYSVDRQESIFVEGSISHAWDWSDGDVGDYNKLTRENWRYKIKQANKNGVGKEYFSEGSFKGMAPEFPSLQAGSTYSFTGGWLYTSTPQMSQSQPFFDSTPLPAPGIFQSMKNGTEMFLVQQKEGSLIKAKGITESCEFETFSSGASSFYVVTNIRIRIQKVFNVEYDGEVILDNSDNGTLIYSNSGSFDGLWGYSNFAIKPMIFSWGTDNIARTYPGARFWTISQNYDFANFAHYSIYDQLVAQKSWTPKYSYQREIIFCAKLNMFFVIRPLAMTMATNEGGIYWVERWNRKLVSGKYKVFKEDHPLQVESTDFSEEFDSIISYGLNIK